MHVLQCSLDASRGVYQTVEQLCEYRLHSLYREILYCGREREKHVGSCLYKTLIAQPYSLHNTLSLNSGEVDHPVDFCMALKPEKFSHCTEDGLQQRLESLRAISREGPPMELKVFRLQPNSFIFLECVCFSHTCLITHKLSKSRSNVEVKHTLILGLKRV